MTDSPCNRCDVNHRALQDHESGLVVGQLSPESILELCNSEGATDVDGDGYNSDSVREDAEYDALPEVEEVKVQVASSHSTCSVDKLHAECDIDCQADDLESKTSNHDIDTNRRWISSILRGSQRPSSSLEHKTDKITHHECEGIKPWDGA